MKKFGLNKWGQIEIVSSGEEHKNPRLTVRLGFIIAMVLVMGVVIFTNFAS